MNDTATSAPGASLLPDSTDMITGIHIGIMAVLALLAIAVIVWGARLKHKRKAAEAELRAHNEDIAGPAAEAETSDDGTARPAVAPPPAPPPHASAPVAHAPPPIADSPVLATPPVEAPAAEPTPPARRNDQPIAAATPQPDSPAPVTTPAPAAAATATATADPAAGPVTLLKGLGPKVATRLADLGITNVGQLAALDDAAAARLDADLAPFSGRMARDRWIEQARLLAAGDKAGFEATFGRL